jgi:tetratricopeptide (TPR) repeat protein
VNIAVNPSRNELESLIAGSDNSPASIRAILNKFAGSKIFAVTDKPWDGRSIPGPDMHLLLVSDGTNHQQPMLALFSAGQHAHGITTGDHPFKHVVEVDAAWALLGVADNVGIIINPNTTDAPPFRIGPGVAAELKKYAEDRLRAKANRARRASESTQDEVQKPFITQVRALLSNNDLPGARAAIENVLAITPADYHALHLAGEIAIEQYRNREAVDYFSAAVKAAPDRASAAASMSGLGQAFTWLGQFDAAEDALRKAIQTDSSIPGPLRALAEAKAEKGDVHEAIELFRRLIALLPQDMTLYVRIGDLLRDSGQSEEALGLYDVALGIKPGYAPAHFNKGVALHALGRMEDAMICYRKAHEVGPWQAGFYRIASLKKFTSAEDPDIEHLKPRTTDNDANILSVRIDANFSLAKAYDDLGDYATAFKYLRQGNDLKRPQLDFSLDEQRMTFAKVIALFTPSFMERFKERQKSAARPIFVLGMPRSGTTLLEQMLAGHPDIFGAGELSAMQIIATQVGAEWGQRGDRFPGTDEELRADFAQATTRYDRLTGYLPRGARRLTDKMPQNFLFIGLMELMFDDYTVIHCRRHPVASGLSCYQHLFNEKSMQFSYKLEEIAEYYKLYAGLMAHWHKLLPGKILDVDYEEVIADPETQIRRVLSHAGLEFDPACLDYQKLDRPVYTSSNTQVRQPLYNSSVEKWKHYEPYLQQLIEGLGDLAKGWPKAG